jgi:hypothetical protein
MPLSAQENKTYLSGIKENARVHIKEGKKNRSSWLGAVSAAQGQAAERD